MLGINLRTKKTLLQTCSASTCIQRQNSLDCNIHGRNIKGFKHDLSHFLPVGLRIQWCFSEEHRMFLGSYTKLVVEGVVPDLFHIIPIADNPMLDRVFQSKYTSLGLSFIPNIGILLSHPHHNTCVSWPPDDTRKHSPRSIISGKSSLP